MTIKYFIVTKTGKTIIDGGFWSIREARHEFDIHPQYKERGYYIDERDVEE